MVIVYLSGDPVHDLVLKAFYDGIDAEKKLVEGFQYEPSDIAVVFGVYKSRIRKSWSRGKVFRQQRENKKDVIVLETGYVNRGDGNNHYYAAGFNGLNGRADFRNKSSGVERWVKLDLQLRPYSPGRNIILCGQIPWDASCDHVDLKAWLQETAQKLKAITTRPVLYRSHPLLPHGAMDIKGVESASGGTLMDVLKDAHCVVTFNSNSAVDALIYGKPVFVFDEGSMVYELANKNLADIEEPKCPERKQWAANLAYTQWTPAEMSEGHTWKHLTR